MEKSERNLKITYDFLSGTDIPELAQLNALRYQTVYDIIEATVYKADPDLFLNVFGSRSAFSIIKLRQNSSAFLGALDKLQKGSI
jgi:hypothetical protein